MQEVNDYRPSVDGRAGATFWLWSVLDAGQFHDLILHVG